MHDALAIGIPVLVILFGILLNQRGLDKLETRMDAQFRAVDARFNGVDGRFNGVDGRLDRMQSDLAAFYRYLGEHDADIENLKKIVGRKSYA